MDRSHVPAGGNRPRRAGKPARTNRRPGWRDPVCRSAGTGHRRRLRPAKTGERSFELTKMGVRASARGLKVGEFLLRAVIDRALDIGAEPLYLLTNKKCEAAIHLYEKAGFEHDAAIMARYGARYERCNVAMRYVAAASGAGAAPSP